MTTWDAFVSCLASDFPDQAWDDHACIQGDELLASFRDEDWAALIGNWQRQPETWQIRCAGCLASSLHPAAGSVAMDMLERSPSDRVAFCAADSLRLILHGNPMPVPGPCRARVKLLMSTADGLRLQSLAVLESLFD